MTANDAAARAGRLAVWAALAACLSTSLGGSSFVAMRFLVTETEPTFDEELLAAISVADLLTTPVNVLADNWKRSHSFKPQ